MDDNSPQTLTPVLGSEADLLIGPQASAETTGQVRSKASLLLLGISLVLVAFNLRPVFSSLSVLLPEIRNSTGLSPMGLSLLTTLPVLCLGLFAPLAPALARRIGTDRVMLAVCVLVAAGSALRGLDSIAMLYVGTALAGIAIAFGNTLLPGLVKRDFPGNLAILTGLYSMALCGGAASGAALTLPIESMLAKTGFGGGWQAAMAAWSLPALAAAAIWSIQLFRRSDGPPAAQAKVKGLLHDVIAWQVTAFMGLQSALAYIIFGWLAPILRLRGMDGVSAGFMVSLLIMMQVASSILVPLLGAKARDQRLINVALVALSIIGLLGMMFGPLSSVWCFALLQGIGQGGLFAIAMTVIALRSPDARVAAQLSGMAQGVGYLIAALGPLLMGLLLEKSDGLVLPALFVVAIGLACAAAGLGAGRAKLVKVIT